MLKSYPIEGSPYYKPVSQKRMVGWGVFIGILVSALFVRVAITTDGAFGVMMNFVFNSIFIGYTVMLCNYCVFRMYYKLDFDHFKTMSNRGYRLLRPDTRYFWANIPVYLLVSLYLFHVVMVVIYDVTGWYIDLYPYSILDYYPDIWKHSKGTLDIEIYRVASSLYLIHHPIRLYIITPIAIILFCVSSFYWRGKGYFVPRQENISNAKSLFTVIVLIGLLFFALEPSITERNIYEYSRLDVTRTWLPYGLYQLMNLSITYHSIVVFLVLATFLKSRFITIKETV